MFKPGQGALDFQRRNRIANTIRKEKMNRLFVASMACVIMALSACTYTYRSGEKIVEYVERPDGTKTATITEEGEEIEIKLDGLSTRQIIKLLLVPNMDGQDDALTPVLFQYRYEYRFDLYNTSGVFVDTLTFETFNDFVDMIPLIFELGGMSVPPQAELDDLAAEMSLFWLDPAVDWARFN